MKQFISIVNASIPFGKALNALAHTAIGIGHWLPKEMMPNIMVLFADEKTIRELRQEAHRIVAAHPTEAIYSDFTNTMTVGPTDNCIKTTSETPENQLEYYCASICADEKLLDLNRIIGRCKTVKNYKPYTANGSENDFAFKKITELPDYQSLPTKKISLTLDRMGAPAELINAAVIASLSIGMQGDLSQLKLLVYTDGDGQKHPYISYHPFPILAARQQAKFNELAKAIGEDQSLMKKIVRDKDGNTISVCILGSEDQVNAHTRQKFISLWTTELSEGDF